MVRAGELLHSAAAVLNVYGPAPVEVRVNEHLNFVLNGNEWFPVGTIKSPWEYPSLARANASISYSIARDPERSPDQSKELADLGRKGRYTTLFPHPTSAIWSHQGQPGHKFALKPLRKDHARQIAARVAQFKHQPGLWAWYLADEPWPTRHAPVYLKQLADTVRSADPYRPCYISYNRGSGAAIYDEATDALGVHWYVRFTDTGPIYPIESVAEHMEEARKGVRDRKAIIYTPQLCMYTHKRKEHVSTAPHDQSRCMAYLAITHGARGIIWYVSYGIRSSLEIRIGIPVLLNELRALEHVFLAHKRVKLDVTGPGRQAIHALGKDVGGRLYVIIVNARAAPADVSVALPHPWAKAEAIRELAADRATQPVAAGRIALALKPHEVRIFTTDPGAPKLTSREEVHRRFDKQRRALLATGNLCYRGRGLELSVSKKPDYGVHGRALMVIDGYTDYAGEGCRGSEKGSWVRIDFPKSETVARIEVSTTNFDTPYSGPKQFKDYKLDLLSGGAWQEVRGVVTGRESGREFTWIHRFAPRTATALRLTRGASIREAGSINEIQAFPDQ